MKPTTYHLLAACSTRPGNRLCSRPRPCGQNEEATVSRSMSWKKHLVVLPWFAHKKNWKSMEKHFGLPKETALVYILSSICSKLYANNEWCRPSNSKISPAMDHEETQEEQIGISRGKQGRCCRFLLSSVISLSPLIDLDNLKECGMRGASLKNSKRKSQALADMPGNASSLWTERLICQAGPSAEENDAKWTRHVPQSCNLAGMATYMTIVRPAVENIPTKSAACNPLLNNEEKERSSGPLHPANDGHPNRLSWRRSAEATCRGSRAESYRWRWLLGPICSVSLLSRKGMNWFFCTALPCPFQFLHNFDPFICWGLLTQRCFELIWAGWKRGFGPAWAA